MNVQNMSSKNDCAYVVFGQNGLFSLPNSDLNTQAKIQDRNMKFEVCRRYDSLFLP